MADVNFVRLARSHVGLVVLLALSGLVLLASGLRVIRTPALVQPATLVGVLGLVGVGWAILKLRALYRAWLDTETMTAIARRNRVSSLLRPATRRGELASWDVAEEMSGGGTGAQSEIRAVTRALLVSLEEEIRREESASRRGLAPCRHVRLRANGRAEGRRRRLRLRGEVLRA